MPLDLVKIKPVNVVNGPNSSQTSGSITSELNCQVSELTMIISTVNGDFDE